MDLIIFPVKPRNGFIAFLNTDTFLSPRCLV